MDINQLTEEQAKDELAFYMELTNNQSNEIGRLTTEGMKANMTIRDLRKALQGMIDATKADKEKNDKTQKSAN